MENKEIAEVDYSFDDLNILGVIGKDVFLRGRYNFEQDCVIQIPRQLFKKSLDYWLDDKKDYCERYDHFCGMMGSIRPLDFQEMGTMVVDEDEPKELKVFKFNSIEDFTDMEHG